MMNETLKAIAERFSCRAYSDKVPQRTLLEAIALAAVQAPSGMNRQPWRINVVNSKELIDDMDREGMHNLSLLEDRSSYERILSRGGKLFYNAPCMIVIAVDKENAIGLEMIDCGIAAQNIVLAATSLGLASVHCGMIRHVFTGDRRAEFREKLRIPAGFDCGLGILLGYAEKVTEPHVPDQNKITFIE